MSKFFFKGKIEPKQKHHSYGYNTKRNVKPGTEEQPISLSVQTPEREQEVKAILSDNALFATIEVNPEQAEDIQELNTLLHKPTTTTFEKTPGRNDPCSCGSMKKFKKCCGK